MKRQWGSRRDTMISEFCLCAIYDDLTGDNRKTLHLFQCNCYSRPSTSLTANSSRVLVGCKTKPINDDARLLCFGASV